jgi:non-canonical poly(A) RNA polymerase PAPD5/7
MIERQKYYDPLLTRIQRIVEALWEGARIEVYGSIATKLCLPTSDVDLVIVGRLDYGVVTDLMRELEDKLSDEPWVKVDSVHAIETASIPIIKLTCTEEYCELAVDITFEHTLFHRSVR